MRQQTSPTTAIPIQSEGFTTRFRPFRTRVSAPEGVQYPGNSDTTKSAAGIWRYAKIAVESVDNRNAEEMSRKLTLYYFRKLQFLTQIRLNYCGKWAIDNKINIYPFADQFFMKQILAIFFFKFLPVLVFE